MMAYVGTMMLGDQQPLYDSLHRQGVMCMISVAPTHDRRAEEMQKQGGYELDSLRLLTSSRPIICICSWGWTWAPLTPC